MNLFLNSAVYGDSLRVPISEYRGISEVVSSDSYRDTFVISDRFVVYGPDPRRRELGAACKEKNAEVIRKVLHSQMNKGARYVLINVDGMEAYYGSVEDVIDAMKWLIGVAEEMGVPIAIGSANIDVLKEGLQVATGKVPIILNSLSPSTSIIGEILPYIENYKKAGHKISVIVAGAGESESKKMVTGAPDQLREVAIKAKLGFAKTGIELLSSVLSPDEIIFDVSVGILAKQFEEGKEEFLFIVIFETMRQLHAMYPDLHITAGVNNVSAGEPNLSLVRRTFIAMAMACGMDTPIANAIDIQCMGTIEAAKLLMKDWERVTAEIDKINSFPLNNNFLDYFIDKFDPELKAELEARGYNMHYLFNRTSIPLAMVLKNIRTTAEKDKSWQPQIDENDEELQIVLRVVRLMLGDKNCEFYNKRKGTIFDEPEHIRPYLEKAKEASLLKKIKVVRQMFKKGMLLEEEKIFLRDFLAKLVKKDTIVEAKVFLEEVLKVVLPRRTMAELIKENRMAEADKAL